MPSPRPSVPEETRAAGGDATLELHRDAIDEWKGRAERAERELEESEADLLRAFKAGVEWKRERPDEPLTRIPGWAIPALPPDSEILRLVRGET